MLQTLWPMLVHLAVIGTTLRWFFRRQPRLSARAGAIRWTAILVGLALALHAVIDSRSNTLVLELMGIAGLALVLNFLFFPGTASCLLRRFLPDSQSSDIQLSTLPEKADQ